MTQETADGKGLCCRHMPAQTWEAMRTWSAVKQAIGQFCPFLAGKMTTWPRPGLPGLHRLDKIVSSSTVDPKFPRANFSPSVVSVLVHCAEKGPRASVPHWEKWLHCVVMPAEVMTWWCACCPCPTPAERVTVPCGPLPRWRQLPFQPHPRAPNPSFLRPLTLSLTSGQREPAGQGSRLSMSSQGPAEHKDSVSSPAMSELRRWMDLSSLVPQTFSPE